MRSFDIVPLVGVGPVRFGMPRPDARDALAARWECFRKGMTSGHQTDAFDELGIHIHYEGIDPLVGLLELWIAPDTAFLYEGKDVLRTEALELQRMLAERSEFYDDLGSIIFPKIEIALYRSHPFDPEFEKFDRWHGVSVGRSGYFNPTPKRRDHKKQNVRNPFI